MLMYILFYIHAKAQKYTLAFNNVKYKNHTRLLPDCFIISRIKGGRILQRNGIQLLRHKPAQHLLMLYQVSKKCDQYKRRCPNLRFEI